MPTVAGTGWISPAAYGKLDDQIGQPYADLSELHERFLEQGVLAAPVRNYAKMVTEARRTVVAAALALYHAGVDRLSPMRESMGIVGGGSQGCLSINERYYSDYVHYEKKMARGSLFAYTLPTSALAEIAIHFGINGPLLYVSSTGDPKKYLYRCAVSLMEEYLSAGMLAVWDTTDLVTCMVIRANIQDRDHKAAESSQ